MDSAQSGRRPAGQLRTRRSFETRARGGSSRVVPRPVVLAVLSLLIAVTAGVVDAVGNDDQATNPGAGQVTLGFDKAPPPDAVRDGIPVYKDKGNGVFDATPVTILTVPLGRLDQNGNRIGGLDKSEGLRIRAVVAMSRCNPMDLGSDGELNSPCEDLGNWYDASDSGYDPYIAAKTFLTKGDTDTNGISFDDWHEWHCTFQKHHCQIVFTDTIFPNDLETEENAGENLASYRYFKLKVAAYSTQANIANGVPRDVVELEADCPGGDFNACTPTNDELRQLGHGSQLTVIRLGSGRSDTDTWTKVVPPPPLRSTSAGTRRPGTCATAPRRYRPAALPVRSPW